MLRVQLLGGHKKGCNVFLNVFGVGNEVNALLESKGAA